MQQPGVGRDDAHGDAGVERRLKRADRGEDFLAQKLDPGLQGEGRRDGVVDLELWGEGREVIGRSPCRERLSAR
jgi:hypothetical protein